MDRGSSDCCGDTVIDRNQYVCCDGVALERLFADKSACCNGSTINSTDTICCQGNQFPRNEKTVCCGKNTTSDMPNNWSWLTSNFTTISCLFRLVHHLHEKNNDEIWKRNNGQWRNSIYNLSSAFFQIKTWVAQRSWWTERKTCHSKNVVWIAEIEFTTFSKRIACTRTTNAFVAARPSLIYKHRVKRFLVDFSSLTSLSRFWKFFSFRKLSHGFHVVQMLRWCGAFA